MLEKMKTGFVNFQRLYRRYREKIHQERTETRWRQEKELNEDITRKRDFRQSLKRNLNTLGFTPANKLDEYFVERQEKAAKTIQAVFRGVRVRTKLPELWMEKRRRVAAINIQRQVGNRGKVQLQNSLSTVCRKLAESKGSRNFIGCVSGRFFCNILFDHGHRILNANYF